MNINDLSIETVSLKEQYLAIDRNKDQYIATMIHELLNPISSISNSLDLLKIIGTFDSDGQEVLDTIERQVSSISLLVRDLMDISSIKAGKVRLNKERVSLCKMMRNAVVSVEGKITEFNHKLISRFPTNSDVIEVDPTRMEQVLTNLLINAAKYTKPGGNIEFSSEIRENFVFIQIKDNGIGIAADRIHSIFDPFFQIDEETRGGIGVGLTLVKQFVELHGGTVLASSEGIGKGTSFVIQIPILENYNLKITKKILIVDPNQDIDLFNKFNKSDYKIKSTSSLLEAIELISLFEPDIIICDIIKSKINIKLLTEQFRFLDYEEQRTLVALSNYTDEVDINSILRAGFDYHFSKPVNFDQLQMYLTQIR